MGAFNPALMVKPSLGSPRVATLQISPTISKVQVTGSLTGLEVKLLPDGGSLVPNTVPKVCMAGVLTVTAHRDGPAAGLCVARRSSS